jgi:hypothetical protein
MPNKPSWRRYLLGIGALVAIALAGWGVVEFRTPEVTALRADLDLRDGVLSRRGATESFAGLLIEEWQPGQRRAEVAIRDGRAHGRSRGWYENGRLEVEETFVRGVSDGTRTRWFDTGAQKSSVKIRAGQMVGSFREWHPNGQLARETPLIDGVAHGEVRAWDPQGRPLGSALVDHGKLVKRD